MATKEIRDETDEIILDETGNAIYDESATNSDGLGYILDINKPHYIIPDNQTHYIL